MIYYYGINSVYQPKGILEPVFAKGGLMMSFFYLKKGKDPRFNAVKKFRKRKGKR